MGIKVKDTNTYQVLMPMGGLGQRFQDQGYSIPKPLILVNQKPMYEHVLESLLMHKVDFDLIAIIRSDHDAKFDFKKKILARYPTATVVILDSNTRGPVETALFAEKAINPNKPIFVVDCDIAFSSHHFLTMAQQLKSNHASGGLMTFNSNDPRYSYAQINSNSEVIRTAEKKVISENALMGIYGFESGSYFLEVAKELLAKGINPDRPEFYMSDLFMQIIQRNNKVISVQGDFFCFGTPEELIKFEETGLPIQSRN